MTQVYYMMTDALKLTGDVCDTLSSARREKIFRAKREADKRLLLGAGLLLDRALRPFGLSERDAKITLGAYGKPRLADRNDLFFSLSHSGNIALCAVSDREIGADVESPRPIRDALLRRVCAESEYAALLACAPEEKEKLFLRLWTAKESYLKYLGTGLTQDLRRLCLLREGLPAAPEAGLFLHEYAIGASRACICSRDGERAPLEELFP